MDGSRFDRLTRSLTEVRSRRGLTRLLSGVAFGGPLVLLSLAEAEAKRKKKKRKKRKKQGDGHSGAAPDPGATAPPPPTSSLPPSCLPNCAGKQCGDDGCGGSCGTCSGGSACANGACACPGGTELCAGTCRTLCTADTERHPLGCHCCTRRGAACAHPATCCSGDCQNGFCKALAPGAPCQFDAQCQTNNCINNSCQCSRGQMFKPGTLTCCLHNGSPCAAAPTACCAGADRCLGTSNPTCEGLPRGTNCQFDAQCASGTCEPTPVGGGFYVDKCA